LETSLSSRTSTDENVQVKLYGLKNFDMSNRNLRGVALIESWLLLAINPSAQLTKEDSDFPLIPRTLGTIALARER